MQRQKTALAAALLAAFTATSAAACEPNCNDPTVKRSGPIPVWEVVNCQTGPQGGPYTPIACDDPDAVHIGPLGLPVKCFLGSDGREHWASPQNVFEGRKFINHKQGGRWYIDFQE